MTALVALLLTAAPHEWVTSNVVDSLDYREKVAAQLAATATERLAAGQALEAQVAAETCLRVDRYRCSCIRDAGLAQGTMPSADATTLKAVQQNSASYLWEYVSCDETAPDAAAIQKTAAKWSGENRAPAPLSKAALEAKKSEDLLAEGNQLYGHLVPLEAKRRFETCATKQPALCECVRRAGDTWLKINDHQRAIVWWSRYLDCEPASTLRPVVEKDIAASKKVLETLPPWQGTSAEPSTYVRVSSAVALRLLGTARKAVADKRLDDAVTAFTACKLLDYKAYDCTLELAQTLQKLDRTDEAAWLHHDLEQTLPPKDPRRAALQKLP